MPARRRPPPAPCPLPAPSRPLLALGLEGSANKLGVGLILHSPPSSTSTTAAGADPGTVSILSNIRHTYVTPPGEGFLPSDTARHHKRWAGEVVEKALKSAGKTMQDVDVVCFTKGASAMELGQKLEDRLNTDPCRRCEVYIQLRANPISLYRTRYGRAATNCRTRRSHAGAHVQQASGRSQPLRWA